MVNTVCVHQDATSITLACSECGALLTYVFGTDPNQLRPPCEHLVVRDDGSSAALSERP